jgi:hypothetical protein
VKEDKKKEGKEREKNEWKGQNVKKMENVGK